MGNNTKNKMNTKKEIVKFLEELAIGVQDKLKHEREKIEDYRKKVLLGMETQKNIGLLNSFTLGAEHTEGQLYEINYILSTITRDNRKKI